MDTENLRVFELYHLDTRKGTSTRVSERLLTPESDVVDFALGPRSRRAVYLADREVDRRNELYLVELKSGQVTKLNTPLGDGGTLNRFVLGPKGRQVLYNARVEAGAVMELFHVNLDTRAVTKLAPGPVAGGGAFEFQFGRKGRTALFWGDYTVDEDYALYQVDLRTFADPVQVTPTMVENGDADDDFLYRGR